MKSIVVAAGALAAATGLALAAAPDLPVAATDAAASTLLLAANADNPYSNVNHRNDGGNDTGDGKADRLNAGHLDRNFKGPYTYRGVGTDTGTATDSTPAAPPPQAR